MKKVVVLSCFACLLISGCDTTTRTSNSGLTEAYQAQNRGAIRFENPEVYELVNIAIYLGGYDQSNHQAYFKNSEYAKSVNTYFASYRTHPCISEFSQKVRSIEENYATRDTSYEYQLSSEGKITRTGVYSGIINYKQDLFPSLIPNLEAFAKATNFRKFYQSQKPYFERVQKTSKALMDVDGAKKWLEARYPNRIESYRIIASPLTGGNHRTHRGSRGNFTEILMFVSSPPLKKAYFQSDQIQSMRVVFTEIDHNYVNPMTDRMKNQLDEALSPLSYWAFQGTDSAHYDGTYGAFNEYMTWSLFSLFLLDKFPENLVEPHLVQIERQMVSRGFVRFKEFNRQAMRYRKQNPQFTGESLQSHLIDWCITQK